MKRQDPHLCLHTKSSRYNGWAFFYIFDIRPTTILQYVVSGSEYKMSIKRMHVDGQGLNRFFGPLESKIMDNLWSSPP